MGFATAYWLSKAGKRVLVLEMDEPGNAKASSSDESRLIRHLYKGRDVYTDMVAESIHLWKDFEHEVGAEFYLESGVLMLQAQPGNVPLVKSFEGLERLGYKPQWLDTVDLRRRFPQFDGIEAGVYTASGGFIRARPILLALAKRSAELGAHIKAGVEVVELVKSGGRISSVRARDGRAFEGDAYVIACGSWTPRLLPDLQIPIKSTAARLHYLSPADPAAYTYPRFVPFAVMDALFYGFPVHWNGSMKIADDQIGPEFDPDADREGPDPKALSKLRNFLRAHLPGLVDADVTYSKTCTYAMTPDADFIIDAVPGAPNGFVAAGFSGHGFKFAILIGRILCDLVLHGRSEHSIHPFRLDRQPHAVEEHW